MEPRTLLVCVHVTRAVFSSRRGRRFSGVRMGDELVGLGWGEVVEEEEDVGVGFHHFTVWDWRLARRTQAAMLASWSNWEMMRVELGGRERMRERLEKSWVVEGPITRNGDTDGDVSELGWI